MKHINNTAPKTSDEMKGMKGMKGMKQVLYCTTHTKELISMFVMQSMQP